MTSLHLDDATRFIDAIARAKPFIGTDARRDYLHGVHLLSSRDGLIVEACDGQRALRVTLPDIREDGIDTTLGAATVKRLASIRRRDRRAPLTLTFGEDAVFARLGETDLGALPLQGGTFPDVGRCFPRAATPRASVPGTLFRRALEPVAAFVGATERSSAVRVSLENAKLHLVAHSPDGTASTSVECAPAVSSADMFEAGYNAQYLLDYLEPIDGAKVTWAAEDYLSPALFTRADDPRETYILMPLRI